MGNYVCETIDLNIDDRHVATLCLNRPDKHNALSEQMLDEIRAAATALATDSNVRIVVLTAKGHTFCAGGDLRWMKEQVKANSDQRAIQAAKVANMLKAINSLPKPVIGALQGNAFGGGVGLAAVCDISIGIDSLTMGLTEVRLGLIPATIGPYVVKRIGERNARRVFLSGSRFDAKMAVEMGILNYVVPKDKLYEAVRHECDSLLECAPRAVGAAKQLIFKLSKPIDDETIAMSIDALTERWNTDEAHDGIDAFFARRKPAWFLARSR